MSVTEESISKFFEEKEQESPSLSPKLKPETFFWDRIISFFAFTIFGLSISGIIAEFFKPDDNSLACFSRFENRAQYTYINSYCHKHLSIGEFFPLVLVAHAVFIVLPHYFWKVFFSTDFDSFFNHVARIEILREDDTRKYLNQNYRIVNYLRKEFGNRTHMFKSYRCKLVGQLFLVFIMIAANIIWYTQIDHDIVFECSDENEKKRVFGNVTCANPRELFINILIWTDCAILILAATMLLLSLYLYHCCCISKEHYRLLYKEIAQLCYDSCINPQYHYEPSGLHPTGWFRITDDFSFLLASLNFGLRRVFKTILLENIISQISGDDLQKFTQSTIASE